MVAHTRKAETQMLKLARETEYVCWIADTVGRRDVSVKWDAATAYLGYISERCNTRWKEVGMLTNGTCFLLLVAEPQS